MKNLEMLPHFPVKEKLKPAYCEIRGFILFNSQIKRMQKTVPPGRLFPIRSLSKILLMIKPVIFFILFTAFQARANDALRVTGKITGNNGEPLSGVSVQEKGTNNG